MQGAHLSYCSVYESHLEKVGFVDFALYRVGDSVPWILRLIIQVYHTGLSLLGKSSRNNWINLWQSSTDIYNKSLDSIIIVSVEQSAFVTSMAYAVV